MKNAGEQILKLFEDGKTPLEIVSIGNNKNTTYKWYKAYLLLEVVRESQKRLTTGGFDELSQKQCEKLLQLLKLPEKTATKQTIAKNLTEIHERALTRQ